MKRKEVIKQYQDIQESERAYLREMIEELQERKKIIMNEVEKPSQYWLYNQLWGQITAYADVLQRLAEHDTNAWKHC